MNPRYSRRISRRYGRNPEPPALGFNPADKERLLSMLDNIKGVGVNAYREPGMITITGYDDELVIPMRELTQMIFSTERPENLIHDFREYKDFRLMLKYKGRWDTMWFDVSYVNEKMNTDVYMHGDFIGELYVDSGEVPYFALTIKDK